MDRFKAHRDFLVLILFSYSLGGQSCCNHGNYNLATKFSEISLKYKLGRRKRLKTLSLGLTFDSVLRLCCIQMTHGP